MNGIISRKSIRLTLIAAISLVSGFVSGVNYHGLDFTSLLPEQEIDISKISWISGVFEAKNYTLATVDYPASKISSQEIALDEFHLPAKIMVAKQSARPQHFNNFKKLEEAVARLNGEALFKELRQVNARMRQHFVNVVTQPRATTESIRIVASSAKVEQKSTKTHQVKLINQPVSTQNKLPKLALKASPTVPRAVDLKVKHEEPLVTVNPKAAAYALKPLLAEVESIRQTQSSALNTEESNEKSLDEATKNEMQERLIAEHVRNYRKIQTQAKIEVVPVRKIPAPPPTTDQGENEVDHNNDVNQYGFTPPEKKDEPAVKTCEILPKLHLLKPLPAEIEEGSQACPEKKEWISKSWSEQGWVKVETAGYFPFMTYYPQTNSNTALLLDQNAVALIVMKAGIQFAKGMGMILGTLPEGYKIDYSGRAEEVQYFEVKAKKYFVILNVEPGAGVTELVSEKDQIENATVFTPVLGDTITYLDLAAPTIHDIPVKVVKYTDEPKKQFSEVAGLTVGMSTQTGVQAITLINGSAILRNVRLVPGFPVYVDVSSKRKDENGYQYRYELRKRTKRGVFLLKQYPEDEIARWLGQLRTGISPQSAMVIGHINPKRLDGFRKHFFMRVQAKTESFGLEPKNFTLLWNDKLSEKDPLEGDVPRFLTVQVPEGLSQTQLINENNQIVQSTLIPVSPRIIHVISE